MTALLDRGFGADFATTDMCGWNSLPHLVLRAESPDSGEELKMVRILLPVVGDVLAKDCDGLTVFDRVKRKRPALPLPWREDIMGIPYPYGSYQQDLLYCALLRSGLYTLHDLPSLKARPRFTRLYTPQHYRALLYLQTWDEEADPMVLTHPLLNEDPLLDEERERAPAFHEWNLSDLSMMEERLEHAAFLGRVQDYYPEYEVYEWTDASESAESEDLDSDLSVYSAEEDFEEPKDQSSNVPVEKEEVSGSTE
jgi:hypothetical protein